MSSGNNLYLVKRNNYKSVMVNVLDCELPYVCDDRIDDIRIQFFHESYYNILICLSIIEELIKIYDKEVLNQKFVRLFKCYSSDKCNIDSIDMLREMLIYSKETYYNECDKYSKGLECGSLLHLGIISVNSIKFIKIIKDCLELDSDFCLVIGINKNMSKLSLRILRDYMKSKYNTVFFVKIVNKDESLNNGISRVRVIDY